MTFAPPLRSRPRPGAIALTLAWLLLLGVLAAAAGYVFMAPELMAPELKAGGPGMATPPGAEPPEPDVAEAETAEPAPETMPEPAALVDEVVLWRHGFREHQGDAAGGVIQTRTEVVGGAKAFTGGRENR